MTKKPYMIILAGLIILLLLAPESSQTETRQTVAYPDSLTDAEKSWLDAHPVIRLAPDPEFQPIEFFDQTGQYTGLAADIAAALEQRLGIRFTIVRCANWDDVIQRTKRREVDLLNAVVKTPQRETYLTFPSPYLTIPSVIIVRKSVNQDLTLDMLRGMHVVMVSNYGYADLIRNQYPDLFIELVPELKTALRKVSFGMADAFVGDLATASFYIESEKITNLKVAGETDPPNVSGFAVRSDWPELASILEKTMATITPEEQSAIYDKWIHLSISPGPTLEDFKTFLMILGGGVVLVMTGFLLWNRQLKVKVQQKTRSLEKEIEERKKTEQALVKSEELFQLITGHTSCLVSIYDAAGNYIYASPSHEQLGYQPVDLIGKPGFTTILKEDQSLLIEKLRQGQQGKITTAVLNYRVKDINGRIHHFRGAFDAVFKSSGRLEKIISVGENITELQTAQADTLKALSVAAEANKLALVGQIAGKMAHDFNNILGAIMGNAELALLDCPHDLTRKTLELILTQTVRGKNLTRNLVAFAKDHEPKLELFFINEKIDLVLDLLKKDLEGIQVIRKYDRNLPEVLADPGMIEHAMVNLIQNSIHATSLAEQPEISVRTTETETQIQVEIQDNGCGIPAHLLEKIFEPSFTLKGSKDDAGAYRPGIKGTGYGMANVKKYVEQHQGTIAVESDLHQGTRVTIGLPLNPKPPIATGTPQKTQQKGESGKKILLVEDEAAICDVQYQILTQAPFRHDVDIAADGGEAMDLIKKNTYDLVSLDYTLPGRLNGMDVYHHIRERDSRVPILFISGNIEFLESIRDLKQKDPLIDHLSKPCKNIDYINHVNQMIAKGMV